MQRNLRHIVEGHDALPSPPIRHLERMCPPVPRGIYATDVSLLTTTTLPVLYVFWLFILRLIKCRACTRRSLLSLLQVSRYSL